ncbi:MAG: hypothetical protein PHE73_07375 [Sulfurovaceae bacterium]|nr:hypothetical protein [Sulfurovaceae bacterium]
MKKFLIGIFILTSLALINGCAVKSSKIKAEYISPVQYQSFECTKILDEMQRVSVRTDELSKIQDKAAHDDTVKTIMGVLIFSGIILTNQKKTGNEPEIAQLKGKYEALEEISLQKHCQNIAKK